MNYPLPVLSIIDPSVRAIPYAVILVLCLLAATFLLVRYPKLRQYRRKQNIAVYVIMASIICIVGFVVGFLAWPSAYVAVSVGHEGDRYYAGNINSLDVTSSSDGGRPASYHVVLRAINASFVFNGQPDDTAIRIKIPFSFQSRGSGTVQVDFTVNQGVAGFQIIPHIERERGSQIIGYSYGELIGELDLSTGRYTTRLQYVVA